MSFKRVVASDQEKPRLVSELDSFISRWRTLRDSMSNIADKNVRKQAKRTLREVEVLARKIEKEIEDGSIPPEVTDRLSEFQKMKEEFERSKTVIQESIDTHDMNDMMKVAADEPNHPLVMSLIDEEQAELDMVQGASREIVSQMKVLNEATHRLNNTIQDQHKVLVNIDKTIVDARDEMIAGNEELATAEEYQKESGHCLYYILGLVGTIAILVGVVCAWLFWVNK